eukprot:2251849-Amphidinium_carterae.2
MSSTTAVEAKPGSEVWIAVCAFFASESQKMQTHDVHCSTYPKDPIGTGQLVKEANKLLSACFGYTCALNSNVFRSRGPASKPPSFVYPCDEVHGLSVSATSVVGFATASAGREETLDLCESALMVG